MSPHGKQPHGPRRRSVRAPAFSAGASRHRPGGFALVEALVALLVAAFAALGLASLQAVQRGGAEHARHLGEALRLAQAEVERARAEAALGATHAELAHGDGAGAARPWPPAAPQPGSNAQFSVERAVERRAAGAGASSGTSASPLAEPVPDSVVPLGVVVRWTDRRGTLQAMTLRTLLARSAPELIGPRLLAGHAGGAPGAGADAGTAPAAADAAVPALALPAAAVDEGNGTHRFSPPGGEGTVWRLDSRTGQLRETCDAGGRCEAQPAWLVHGLVRFAPGPAAPGPAQAEAPPGPAQPLQVRLVLRQPREAVVECFETSAADHLVFHCAVPLPAGQRPAWSGRIVLDGLRWAARIDDADAAAWRVCRYGAPPAAQAAGAPGAAGEVDIDRTLRHRNFLVIRAGDGTRPFDCPGDDPSTPWLDGRTWHHQPDR